MKIDSHQHFWNYSTEEYRWIDNMMETLKRDFLPSHLAPLVDLVGFDGTIAVQARQTVEETQWLLKLAEENEFIKGVVGWVPLCNNSVDEYLTRFMKSDKLLGVRHVLQDEPDDRFMLRSDFINGMKCLGKYDLAYDLLILPKHLDTAVELVSLFPDQNFILDHIAKPLIKSGSLDGWEKGLKRLSQRPNVWCKLSGMVTEADWHNWKSADLIPYIDVVLQAFGAERVMIGSDWPVCTVAADYQKVMSIVIDYISTFSESEQAGILGCNAEKVYLSKLVTGNQTY